MTAVATKAAGAPARSCASGVPRAVLSLRRRANFSAIRAATSCGVAVGSGLPSLPTGRIGAATNATAAGGTDATADCPTAGAAVRPVAATAVAGAAVAGAFAAACPASAACTAAVAVAAALAAGAPGAVAFAGAGCGSSLAMAPPTTSAVVRPRPARRWSEKKQDMAGREEWCEERNAAATSMQCEKFAQAFDMIAQAFGMNPTRRDMPIFYFVSICKYKFMWKHSNRLWRCMKQFDAYFARIRRRRAHRDPFGTAGAALNARPCISSLLLQQLRQSCRRRI